MLTGPARVTRAWYDPKVRGEVHFDMDREGGQWHYTLRLRGYRDWEIIQDLYREVRSQVLDAICDYYNAWGFKSTEDFLQHMIESHVTEWGLPPPPPTLWDHLTEDSV